MSKDNEKSKERKTSGTLTTKRVQGAAKGKSSTSPKGPLGEGDVETRLAHLEQRVVDLEEALRRESARLRRAIILSDDFGEL